MRHQRLGMYSVRLCPGFLLLCVLFLAGCSGGPSVDPSIKVEEGAKAEDSIQKTRRLAKKKVDPAPARRTKVGLE